MNESRRFQSPTKLALLMTLIAGGCAEQLRTVPPRMVRAPAEMSPVTLHTAPADEPGEVIRVGAWNIEHFGSPGSRNGVGRDVPQDKEKLAAAITRADVDILAVSEIYATEAVDDTWYSEHVDELIGELDGKLPNDSVYGWNYILFQNARKADTSQICGVLWNENTVELESWWPLPVDGGKRNGRTLWDRRPHAAKFSTGENMTDLVIIPLHMKAGGSYKKHRGVEAQQVIDILDDVRDIFADNDILLIGDTNCKYGDEEAVAAFISAGFLDLNGSGLPTTPWGNALDRAIAAGADVENKEFVRDLTVFDGDDMDPPVGETEFRRLCSDHFMIYTHVRMIQDDDPPQ